MSKEVTDRLWAKIDNRLKDDLDQLMQDVRAERPPIQLDGKHLLSCLAYTAGKAMEMALEMAENIMEEDGGLEEFRSELLPLILTHIPIYLHVRGDAPFTPDVHKKIKARTKIAAQLLTSGDCLPPEITTLSMVENHE